MVRKYLMDWRTHAVALLFIVVAEFIGVIPIKLGPLSFSLLPMLYVLVFGIVCGAAKIIPKKVMEQASPCITIATMWLAGKLSFSIGPNLGILVKAGPALLLQEFGNLGTIFLSVPLAVFVFKMGRQAVGAGFSNSREGSIALVGSIYGLDGPEGQGVMGAYMTGTILGAIFSGIMSSVFIALPVFHPFALAMAAGTGSASMMAAGMGPIVEAYPNMANEISAFATTSNLLSSIDGLYMSLFIGIPLANWLYKALKGPERFKKAEQKRAAKRAEKLRSKGIEVEVDIVVEQPAAAQAKPSFGKIWALRVKVLIVSGLFMVVANWISTFRAAGEVVGPLGGLPGILIMFVPAVLGFLVYDFMSNKFPKVNIPALLYASFFGIIMSLPIFPGSAYMVAQVDKFGVLPMCTPILAYAGVSIGRDLDNFKRQGLGIVCTALMAFVGTYIGSAVIAQIVLKLTGAI